MINKNDLNKTRYTHRDYESILSDLVSAIPSLTQEWTNREESDPGIVLLKLMAMFGDTLSYNADKMALEMFLSSVTQRKNCANILRLLGYKTHWYRSARVLAHMRLASETDKYGNRNHVILVPYQTTLSAGTTVTYTVINQGAGSGEIDIYSSTDTVPVMLVEGKAVSSSFSKVDLVNNRYYFNSSNIDESEIILEVSSGRDVHCQLVDSLYLASSNTTLYYEFDVDEYDRPYIQLSDDWEDIVGSSVVFKLTYILSSGSRGNVSSNAFTVINGQKSGGDIRNLVVTNLPNTTNYYSDGITLDTYNSPGYNPQTVDESRDDSANYVFTYDTLVTPPDYEKSCKRVDNITVSKLVDSQVIIDDSLDLDEIISRALDSFKKVEVEEQSDEDPEVFVTNEYLAAYQVILYLGYRNFDPDTNYYYSSPKVRGDKGEGWSLYHPDGQDPYSSEYPQMSCGYYPYKPNENILQCVRETLKKLHLVSDKVDFGTLKLFPFRVTGTVHLVEPLSPQETLQIVDIIDTSLKEAYYPDLHPVGEKPNFIELVDIIQNSDVRVKYFDAIGNIVEWAPAVQTQLDRFDEIFDTTSAIMYNGLSDDFNLNKRFLKYRIKNIGTIYDTEDEMNVIEGTEGTLNLPEDYGTAYLINYSKVADLGYIKKININTSETLQLNSIKELRAFCQDMTYKGYTPLRYIRKINDTSTLSHQYSESEKVGDVYKLVGTFEANRLVKSVDFEGVIKSLKVNGVLYEDYDPRSGHLDENTISQMNITSDTGTVFEVEFDGDILPSYVIAIEHYEDRLDDGSELTDEESYVEKYTLINNTGLVWMEDK